MVIDHIIQLQEVQDQEFYLQQMQYQIATGVSPTLMPGYSDNTTTRYGEPWTTGSCKIPSRYLEPYILPFPKAVNRHSNHYFNHTQHYSRQTGSVSSIDITLSESDSNNDSRDFGLHLNQLLLKNRS